MLPVLTCITLSQSVYVGDRARGPWPPSIVKLVLNIIRSLVENSF